MIRKLLFFAAFLSSIQASSQTCCSALETGTFIQYCILNVTGCSVGVFPCTEANLTAEFGTTWAIVQCTLESNCGCGGGSVTLPVEMSNFELDFSERGIQIFWSTATETNNKGFFVEHSTDGKEWSSIHFQEGNGTTSQPEDYYFLHEEPRLGANYYRLQQVDFDGGFEYTPVRVAAWRGGIEDLQLVVLPNPATEMISPMLPPEIGAAGSTVTYEIFDVNGRLLRTITDVVTAKGTLIDVKNLEPGNYIFRARQDGIIYNARFVKAGN